MSPDQIDIQTLHSRSVAEIVIKFTSAIHFLKEYRALLSQDLTVSDLAYPDIHFKRSCYDLALHEAFCISSVFRRVFLSTEYFYQFEILSRKASDFYLMPYDSRVSEEMIQEIQSVIDSVSSASVLEPSTANRKVA